MTDTVNIGGARPHGKTIAALMEFIARGKAGDAVSYATPEGSFLSPTAVTKTIKAERTKIAKKLEAIRLKLHNGEDAYKDVVELIRRLDKTVA